MATEQTPLVERQPLSEGPVVTIKVPETLKNVTARASAHVAGAQEFISTQYVKAKEMTKTSPWIISLLVCICCVGVAWAGVFGVLSEVIYLSPMEALIKVYQVLFALLALVLEASRYVDPLGCMNLVHMWFRFLETTIGRGLLQLLPGSIAVAGMESMMEWVPGLGLVGAGVLNIFYGVYAAHKLRSVINKMRDLEKEKMAGRRTGSGDLCQVDLMMSKFSAIDVNGTGKLSQMDLLQACEELKIDMKKEDLDMVFSALDSKNKGYVDLKDFEAWWFKSKASGLFV